MKSEKNLILNKINKKGIRSNSTIQSNKELSFNTKSRDTSRSKERLNKNLSRNISPYTDNEKLKLSITSLKKELSSQASFFYTDRNTYSSSFRNNFNNSTIDSNNVKILKLNEIVK
jgi:hypothetical protein